MRNPDIIAMTADVAIAAADGEAKKGPRGFDVVAYTGGKLVVAGYDVPVVFDLKGLSGRKSIVANLDHDKKLRVGHVTNRNNDGRTLRLEGLASAATAARDEVVASADDGFQWQASIEAAPQKLVKVAQGKKGGQRTDLRGSALGRPQSHAQRLCVSVPRRG